MKEIWVPIKGFERYAVSNYGAIINLETSKRVRAYDSGRGYLRVILYRQGDNLRTQQYVAKLVAMAFFAEYRPGQTLKYIDGDPHNCRANNLRVVSGIPRKYSTKHQTWGDRVRVKETGEVFRTVRDCAAHLGGNYSAIYACLRGDRKSHLGYSFEWYQEQEE